MAKIKLPKKPHCRHGNIFSTVKKNLSSLSYQKNLIAGMIIFSVQLRRTYQADPARENWT